MYSEYWTVILADREHYLLDSLSFCSSELNCDVMVLSRDLSTYKFRVLVIYLNNDVMFLSRDRKHVQVSCVGRLLER